MVFGRPERETPAQQAVKSLLRLLESCKFGDGLVKKRLEKNSQCGKSKYSRCKFCWS